VITVLSGMSTIDQMRENTAAYRANVPFSDAERAAVEETVACLHSVPTVPCTNCRYCVKECPQGVTIPIIMNLLNQDAMLGNHGFVKDLYSWQAREGYASACIQCGSCEMMCPQKIDIIAQLERAVSLFE